MAPINEEIQIPIITETLKSLKRAMQGLPRRLSQEQKVTYHSLLLSYSTLAIEKYLLKALATFNQKQGLVISQSSEKARDFFQTHWRNQPSSTPPSPVEQAAIHLAYQHFHFLIDQAFMEQANQTMDLIQDKTYALWKSLDPPKGSWLSYFESAERAVEPRNRLHARWTSGLKIHDREPNLYPVS